MTDKNTEELFAELKTDNDIKDYLTRNDGEFSPPLVDYLTRLLNDKGLNKKAVINASGIERTYAYHILAGKVAPSRGKLLSLARALTLDLPETQQLLKHGGHAPLYPRKPWDSVIISAIEQNLSVPETNELLIELGEKQLLG